MNYEQKYNAALERAKEYHDNGGAPLILEVIFPELKESEEEKIKRELRNDLILYVPTPERYIAWLEKQGKQPTDKVEPKFKVGDWVVNTVGYTNQVVKVWEGYTLDNDTFLSNSWATEHYHRWTIADAKNGDVISYKGEISLYKHDIKNCTKQETTFGGFVYHCCYDGKRFITDSLYSLTEQDKMDIHPATKEQRDLLFQKMADAGYEFVNGHVTRF